VPIQPKNLQQAFGNFSDLFAEADKRNMTIHKRAVPLLLGAVARVAAFPGRGMPAGKLHQQALSSWSELLDQKQRQVTVQADIIERLKRWFPDPVQGERIPLGVEDWMGKLDI
jgi:hypothetical protein